MPTTYPAAVSFDSFSDRVATTSSTAYDLSTFTVGVLCKPAVGFLRGCIATRINGSNLGWQIELDPSPIIYMHWTGTSQKNDSCGSSFTIGAWNWIFFSWNGTRWNKVRSGLYGGTLTNKTVADDGGGPTLNSVVGQPLNIGGDTSVRPCDTAFMGVWSGVLSDATIDAYAADMEGNGGTAAAIEYFKLRTADQYGVTGGKLGQVGTYTSVTLTAGPDGNKYRAAVTFDSTSDQVTLANTTAYDVSTFTFALLFKPKTGYTSNKTIISRKDSGNTLGWRMDLNATGDAEPRWSGTTEDVSSFASAFTLDSWNWCFVQWNGSSFDKLRSGVYGGTLTNKTYTHALTGSGLTSAVGLPITLGTPVASTSFDKMDIAFFGLWSGSLADATIDAYAANMETSGGLKSAIEYFKFQTTDTAGTQGDKLGIGGSYTNVSLVAGPDASSSVAALRTQVGAAVTGR